MRYLSGIMSKIDEGWKQLFEQYNIAEKIEKNGLFYISADQIREVKEPRLMTKFDSIESLPSVFKQGKIGILPVTRGTYVLGRFNLYEKFPETKPDIKKIALAEIPNFLETIDIQNISSEAGAINVMEISGILRHFLDESEIFSTVSGRMGSGQFTFSVAGKNGIHELNVFNSQLEIDGGFEGPNSFALIEAKNVVHDDFLIRQLYYPARLWSSKISKPVRPVFMVYSNSLFRLLEYEFTDPHFYNSIKLLREVYYTLEDYTISFEDIVEVWNTTSIEPEPDDVPFIQANSFEKVISLIEQLNQKPMSMADIADLFAFVERQSGYYFNACKYLGLVEKRKVENEEGKKVPTVFLSDLGSKILKLPYKKRQLEFCRLMFKHKFFHDLFDTIMLCGEVPSAKHIASKVRELEICPENSLDRRASSIRNWLVWIVNLVN